LMLKNKEIDTLEKEQSQYATNSKKYQELENKIDALTDALATLTTMNQSGNASKKSTESTPHTPKGMTEGAMINRRTYEILSEMAGREIEDAEDAEDFKMESRKNAQLLEDAKSQAQFERTSAMSQNQMAELTKSTSIKMADEYLISKGIDPMKIKEICKGSGLDYGNQGNFSN